MNAETLKELLANVTPGPWRVFGKKTGKIISENAPGIVEIGEIGAFRDPEIVPFNADRWNADARLIALAPELAAEVIKLQAEVESLKMQVEILSPLYSVRKALSDENARLREALREISAGIFNDNGDVTSIGPIAIERIARAALNETRET